MSSEIGNKSLLKRVAESLEIIDGKQMAGRLKTDEVIPVIDLSRFIGQSPVNPPAADEWIYTSYQVGADLAGLSTISLDILPPGIPTDGSHIYRCLDLYWKLSVFTDAPLAGDGAISWHMTYPTGEISVDVMRFEEWDYFAGGEAQSTNMYFVLGGCYDRVRSPTADTKPRLAVLPPWHGLIPPGKEPFITMSTNVPWPNDGNSVATLDIRSTWVSGAVSLGVPPR